MVANMSNRAPFAQVVAAVSEFTRLSCFIADRAIRVSSVQLYQASKSWPLGSLQIQLGEQLLCP